MFTAVMSLALVAIVVAAAFQFSLTMDDMLSQGTAQAGVDVARAPEAAAGAVLANTAAR